MDIHREFTEWAVARGVKLNSIAVHRFPGKGLGIIAEEKLEVCRTNLCAELFHVLFVSQEFFLAPSAHSIPLFLVSSF
jgi:hypothetical protein